MLKKTWFKIALLVVAIFVWFIWHQGQANTPSPAKSASQLRFNKDQLSLSSPNSLWVIVNKKRPLNPKDYEADDLVVPNVAIRSVSTEQESELRQPAANALENMFADAKQAGINLLLVSGYRSYGLQTNVYNNYVKTQGQSVADSQSARPGYSEHQTGLAADIGAGNRKCEIQACFANTKEGKWIAKSAYKYGFVIRYDDGRQTTVGYIYEPWHLRFVGKALANEVHTQNNIPLEKFFDLESAASY